MLHAWMTFRKRTNWNWTHANSNWDIRWDHRAERFFWWIDNKRHSTPLVHDDWMNSTKCESWYPDTTLSIARRYRGCSWFVLPLRGRALRISLADAQEPTRLWRRAPGYVSESARSAARLPWGKSLQELVVPYRTQHRNRNHSAKKKNRRNAWHLGRSLGRPLFRAAGIFNPAWTRRWITWRDCCAPSTKPSLLLYPTLLDDRPLWDKIEHNGHYPYRYLYFQYLLQPIASVMQQVVCKYDKLPSKLLKQV